MYEDVQDKLFDIDRCLVPENLIFVMDIRYIYHIFGLLLKTSASVDLSIFRRIWGGRPLLACVSGGGGAGYMGKRACSSHRCKMYCLYREMHLS